MILKTPMKYTKFVRPACLPDKNFKMKPGSTALITGWGATENGMTSFIWSSFQYSMIKILNFKKLKIFTRLNGRSS